MRAVRVWLCCVALTTLSGCATQELASRATTPQGDSDGERLTPVEWTRLRSGERVEHRRANAGTHYVGGTSYQLVNAAPDEVLQALLDPEELAQMLPQTQRIAPTGAGYPAPGLELVQGNDFATATYSVVLHHDLEKREVRFSLDHSRPSDIKDVRGFFRVEPYADGRSLISVSTALDLGSGLVRLLFEGMIEDLILATPSRMKAYLEAPDSHDATRVAGLDP